MARLQATKDSSVETDKSNNNIVHKPSSSLASRSSLAAAATGSTSYNNSNTFIPSFKKNPLNAAAAVYTVSESSATSENDKTVSNKTTIATTNHDVIRNQVTTVTPSTSPTAAAQKEEVPTKMTLIQQLIHNRKSPINILPPPFSMCSESEAIDRQQHLELSPFECNPSSIKSGAAMLTLSSDHHNTMGSKKAAARRHRPTFNSQYVIKKYRRSAAGGGALSEASDKCPRTLDQLQTTVDYLLGSLFANQMPPGIVNENTSRDPNEISIWEEDGDDTTKQTQQLQQQHTPFSLSETVSFIDDRLRAVQKDLVTLLGNIEESNLISSSASSGNSVSAKRQQLKQQRTKQTVRDMQAKMVRYNILASYLLSDVPSSKYEVKFGARSLRTSLTCYLNLSTTIHEEYQSSSSNNQQQQSAYNTECQTQDEIMAYMALLHSSAVLRNEESSLPLPTSNEITSSLMEDSGSGWGALLTTFSKHVLDNDSSSSTDGVVDKYPRWYWALELACAVQEGNYQRYFALLEKGPTYTVENELAQASNARFLILARCCTSHSLNLIRLAQLRRYNHAFGKGEKVPATNLARLLRLNMYDDEEADGQRAAEFCRGVGLPIIEKEVGDDKASFVVMKSAPINVKEDETIRRICNPGRMNDKFVFGSKFEIAGDVDSLTKQMEKQCGVEASWEDDEDGIDESFASIHARKDEDGVEMPSSNVLSILSCLK